MCALCTKRSAVGPSGGSVVRSSSSSIPMMPASGVRSSCEKDATNVWRACSKRTRSLMSCPSKMMPCSAPPCVSMRGATEQSSVTTVRWSMGLKVPPYPLLLLPLWLLLPSPLLLPPPASAVLPGLLVFADDGGDAAAACAGALPLATSLMAAPLSLLLLMPPLPPRPRNSSCSSSIVGAPRRSCRCCCCSPPRAPKSFLASSAAATVFRVDSCTSSSSECPTASCAGQAVSSASAWFHSVTFGVR